MSNFGQGVTAVVGGVIGFVTTGGSPLGAAYGFQAGLLAGTVLFPTQLPTIYGPRLEDLEGTETQVGVPVIDIWGTIAVPGTVMWMGPVTEISNTEEVGGKGAPEQSVTTYTYTRSVAVGLCEGPITGVIRIWENGDLVYDAREAIDGETDDERLERYEANATYLEGMVLHLGDTDQLPDSTIEAIEGVGNVPGFRDLAYIVYPDRELKADQAFRLPAFRFEVTKGQGDAEFYDPVPMTGSLSGWQNEVAPDWSNRLLYYADNVGNGGDYNTGLRVHRLEDNVEIRQENWEYILADTPRDNTELGMTPMVIGQEGHIYFAYFSGVNDPIIVKLDPDTWRPVLYYDGGVYDYWRYAIILRVPSHDILMTVSNVSNRVRLYDDTTLLLQQESTAFSSAPYNDVQVCAGVVTGSGKAYGYAVGCDIAASGTSSPLSFLECSAWIVIDPVTGDEILMSNIDVMPGTLAASTIKATWTRFTSLDVFVFDPLDDCLIIGVGGAPSVGASTKSLCKFDAATSTVIWSVDMPTLPAGETGQYSSNVRGGRLAIPIGTQTTRYFNTADGTYEDIVWSDDMSSVWTGAWAFDGVWNSLVTFENGKGPVIINFGEPSGPVSLATIVSAVCDRCALDTATDIDVADLEDIWVHGYARGRSMPGREVIEPLRMVGFFDCVESAGVLKFPTRGKANVATLTAEDLGAHQYGDADVPVVTTRKLQDMELPRQVRVHYIAHTRDYEPGEQLSPTRLTTEAVNDMDIELACALDDDQAAQCAEVLWADTWRARWVHQIAFDRRWASLEPADCVTVPVDGRNERIRLVTVDDSDVVLRRAECVRDDDGSYVSYAVAATPERPVSRLTFLATSELILLDLPALRDEDDDAGIYAAIRKTGNGTSWNGAAIFRSSDGGGGFTQLASVVNAATVGTLDAGLPAGITGTWDEENVLEVTLDQGTLASATQAAVLAGANVAAIGSHGNWEIVQFTTATDLGSNRWQLSGLLRGRRGTEHLVGLTGTGDDFVLLSGAGIVRLAVQNAQIGQAMIYRAVTFGAAFATGADQSFTGAGQALECFCPVDVEGTRGNSPDDLVITWLRRDRLHETLQDGVELPMSEASESYSIDIMDTTDVIRTLTSTTETVTYTEAQQITDWGSPPASVTVRVYQLSAIVGRGTPAEATI